MKTSFAILLAIFALSNARKLSDIFQVCHRNDPMYGNCVSKSIETSLQKMAHGDKSLGFAPIEPLYVKKIKIGDNNGPVGLRQEYHNIYIHGLTDLSVFNFRLDFDNLIIYSESMNKKISFIAEFELDGKVLLFPITGKGHSNITMTNVHATNTISCEKYEKNGQTYLKALKYEVKFTPETVNLQFDDSHDSEKASENQLQTLIGGNSELLFKELKGPFEDSFGVVFRSITNKVLGLHPINTFFPA